MNNFLFAMLFLFLANCNRNEDKEPNVNPPSPTPQAKIPLTLADCKKSIVNCASIDIERSDAKEAYDFGCNAGDFYACFRLGQYLEIKSKNIMEALKAYEKSCLGKDQNGCESETELRMDLCYIKQMKSYCKGEPVGEYRILLFLQELNPKYEDIFVNRDFDKPFSLEAVKILYEKRLKEKNKKLLKALKISQKRGHHDGADSEGLQLDIWRLEGNSKMLKQYEE